MARSWVSNSLDRSSSKALWCRVTRWSWRTFQWHLSIFQWTSNNDQANLAMRVSRNWWWASTISSKLSALWICFCNVAHPHSITWNTICNWFSRHFIASPQMWYSRPAGGQSESSRWQPSWHSAKPKMSKMKTWMKYEIFLYRTQLLQLASHLVQAC